MCVCVMPRSMTQARSRLDSGVTRAYSQDRALSFHWFISWIGLCIVSISCFYFFYFSMLMLLLLLFSAFSLPVFSFSVLGTCHRVQPCPALRAGLGALCLLPVWFRGDVLCRMGRR